MGKSGYLPDISHNFGFYRTLAVNSVQKKDYTGAMASLYNLNGCLGEEYLVTVSTEKYEEAMSDKSVYQCNNCTMEIKHIFNEGEDDERVGTKTVPTEIPKANAKIFPVVIPLLQQIIQKSSRMNIWICTECGFENEVEKTVMKVPHREKPFYIRVVWDCPMIGAGIANRLGFVEIFAKWFWNFLEEINWQEVAYRKEYMAQNDGEDMMAYIDKGDDS